MPHLAPPIAAQDHIQGRSSARITLIEYGDFQCPDAGYAYPVVKRLQAHFGDELRFVFRHFPLIDIHPWAEPAAELAEFAASKDKFWQMHDALFENQAELDTDLLADFAAEQGFDAKAAAAAIRKRTHAERIEEDVDGARAVGVHATPTFFLNGIRHEGDYEYEDLVAAIEAI